MIFSAKRFVLLDLATKVAPVVPFNSPRVVLQCFRISVAPASLTFAGTDTDQAIVAATSMVTAEGECTFLVPAHKLTEVLKEAPEGDVTVTVDGSNTAVVRAGSSEWVLVTKDGLGEYPPLPDSASVTWHAVQREPLLAALKGTRHAVSRDRPALSCITMSRLSDGTAKVTAYDGARLEQVVLPAFPFSVQIPSAGSPAAVDELIRLLGGNNDLESVQVAEDGNKLLLRAGSVTFATGKHLARAVDAEAELLVPALASATQVLSVQRDALLGAIRRVRVSSDQETSAIGLRLHPSTLHVLARDKAGNHASEDVEATWAGKEGRVVVLNHRYLSEALAVHPASLCEFRLGPDKSKSRTPVLLRDEASGVTAVLLQGHPKSLGVV